MPSRRIADEIRTNQKNRGLPDQNGGAALSSSESKRPGWDKVIHRSLSGKYNVLSVERQQRTTERAQPESPRQAASSYPTGNGSAQIRRRIAPNTRRVAERIS